MTGYKDFPNPEEDYRYWIEQLYNSMRRVGIRCEERYKPRWKQKRKKHPRQGKFLYNLTNKKERGIIIEANLKLAKSIREKTLWLLPRKKRR